MQKTNAMRILEAAGISYEAKEYEASVDGGNFGARVARLTGLPVERVFKTLALKGGPAGYFVCCIPVDRELSLKKAGAAADDKRADMLPVKELQSVTGYVRGGCTPIGMKRRLPVFIDESALRFDRLGISGGTIGKEIILDPRDLIRVTEANVVSLTKE